MALTAWRNAITLTVLTALPSLWLACSDRESRRLAGDYCLDRMFDGDHYNITGCSFRAKLKGRTDSGPLDGTVSRVGWNKRYILAWRVAMFGNERSGWMLLDTQQQRLEAIFDDESLAARIRQTPELGSIVVYDVNEAWRLLAT